MTANTGSNQMGEPRKFVKKQIVQEAIQWTGNNLRAVIDFTGWHESARSRWTWEEYEQVVAEQGLKIFTAEGPLKSPIGHWIVKGSKGEVWPVRPDYFDTHYEPAHLSAQPSPDAAQGEQNWPKWIVDNEQEFDAGDGYHYSAVLSSKLFDLFRGKRLIPTEQSGCAYPDCNCDGPGDRGSCGKANQSGSAQGGEHGGELSQELALIGKQQMKIEQMRRMLTDCAVAFENIRGTIYCIGGPLNDNKLRYTAEQMRDFKRIADNCLELDDFAPGGALAAEPDAYTSPQPVQGVAESVAGMVSVQKDDLARLLQISMRTVVLDRDEIILKRLESALSHSSKGDEHGAPLFVIDDETREALNAGIRALTEQNTEVSRMISESDYTDTSALSALHCERLQHIAALSRLAGK